MTPTTRAALLWTSLTSLALAQDEPPTPPETAPTEQAPPETEAPAAPPEKAPPVLGGVLGGPLGPAATLKPPELGRMGLALPEGASATGERQYCNVHVQTGRDGSVAKARTYGCDAELIASVEAAAADWRFTPCEKERCDERFTVEFTKRGARWGPPLKVLHWSEVEVRREVALETSSAQGLRQEEAPCRVRFFVDVRGVPYRVNVEDCPEEHREAAAEVAMKWRFYSIEEDGVAMRSRFVMVIPYK